IDFTQENAISSITDVELKAKLEQLTESQIKSLESLTEEDLKNFKDLAEMNIARKDYLNAKEEYEAAEKRVTNANNTLTTAHLNVLE
ncbi:hypothetical protein R2R70_21025, partial [Cobetia sp. SIMBA_158]|uniref:hypothetical protein n=1 Tax=Cobetia sp. SIMBA_158 TaxID=3081617 RepID=UPI00397F3316